MAMTEEQGTTLLSRVSGGESPHAVLRDMEIARADFADWRKDNRTAFREARIAGTPPEIPPTKEEKLTRLQRRKDRLTDRMSRIDAEIAVVEAE